MAKVKEAIEDLQRQKEDIENLLSSLETSFKEGSIPEEHYKEVKQKNSEKLEEIKKKISVAQKQAAKDAEKSAKEEAKAKEEPKPEEPQEEKEKKKEEPVKEEGKKEEKPSIFEELASKASKEKEEANEEKIKEKIIMELAPKIEKINVRLVKLKAYVDAMKEDKTGERESSQRITEEVGETRSAMNTMEGRVGEIEMKLEDVSETLADLKPQKFSKDLQRKDEELKLHEARLEKLDDMNSTILKRVNQIQIILEKLGNIESIAEMTKDISKKLMSLDDKEKKITRLADKIDNMFVEMNKRLEEFMFYKAKQDSLDDLSKEMLKSIDELTTKLTRYAEKDDLELLRDTLENKMSAMSKESAAAPYLPMQQAQQGKSEIESLMKLLDEQFRKGQMSKKDYEKAKEANLQKLRQMAVESMMPSRPALEEAIINQPPVEELKTLPESRPEEAEEESGLSQAAKIAQNPEEAPPAEKIQTEPESGKNEKAKKTQTEAAKLEKKPAEKRPATEPAPEPVLPPKQEKPEKIISKDEVAKKIGRAKREEAAPAPESKPPDKKQKMLSDLEYSFRKGLISQKAYETTQRIIMAKRI